MTAASILLMLAGASLMGWAIYEIDSPYLTLAVGIIAVIIGLATLMPTPPSEQ